MSLLSAVLQEANNAATVDFKKHREELFPKINDITERVQMLTWSLQQNLLDNFVTFTVTKSLEQLNYKNRKGNIDTDFQACADEIKTLRDQLYVFDDEFTVCWQKLCEFYDTFRDMCIAVEGKRVLERANHEFGRFNYTEAILAVQQLKKQIKNLKLGDKLSSALANLNGQAENQVALYMAHLSTEWEDLFSWSKKKGLNYITYSLSVRHSDPILLKKVLKSLYATERLNAELGLFSHFFIDQLLHNVIKHNCDIYTEEPIGAIEFKIRINLNDENKPTYETIVTNLTAIFEFLHSTLGCLDCDRTFIEVFADSIRDKFFSKVIEDCIRNNLPSCDSSYEQYKDIVVELDSFNKFLIDLKFVDADKSPLNKYIDDTECVLYNKKCEKLLSDVRSLLSQSLSHSTLLVGSDDNNNDPVLETDGKENWVLNKPLFLPRCVISQNVKKIMTMILDHLQESAQLPEIYRIQLVSCVKDIAVLYKCIVPKQFKVNLEYCPSDIALLVNNCFYLAHGLVGPPWSACLPPPMAQRLATVLIECIQDLRVLGLEKLFLYLKKQKTEIAQSIRAQEPPTWSPESFEQFDCAVNHALTLMRELKAAWLATLPHRVYETAMCVLVQALCQAIIERVFVDTKPMSEELVQMVTLKIRDVIDDVHTLFGEPINIEDKISTWTRLTKLPLLLNTQLQEASELWNTNQLQCFTCDEVRQIVKIRFPNDKYRLRILKEIQ